MHRSRPCGCPNRPRRRPSCWCTGTVWRCDPFSSCHSTTTTPSNACDAICSRAWSATSDQPESSPESFAPAATPIASSDSAIAPPATRSERLTVGFPRVAAIGARPLSGSDCSDCAAPCELARTAIGGATSSPRPEGDAIRKPTAIAAAAARPATTRGHRPRCAATTATSASDCSICSGASTSASTNPTGGRRARQGARRARASHGLPRGSPATPRRTRGAPPPRRVPRRCTHRRRTRTGPLRRGIRGSRECRSQKPPAAMDARPDGADRNALRARDLVIRESDDVGEHHRRAEFLGQRGERVAGPRRRGLRLPRRPPPTAEGPGPVVRATRPSDDGACGAPRPGTRSSRSGPTRPPTSQG